MATAINHQADLFKGVVDTFQRAKDGAVTMTSAELSATGIELMTRMSMSTLNFTAWTSVGQSMKNAMQTLLKNQ